MELTPVRLGARLSTAQLQTELKTHRYMTLRSASLPCGFHSDQPGVQLGARSPMAAQSFIFPRHRVSAQDRTLRQPIKRVGVAVRQAGVSCEHEGS